MSFFVYTALCVRWPYNLFISVSVQLKTIRLTKCLSFHLKLQHPSLHFTTFKNQNLRRRHRPGTTDTALKHFFSPTSSYSSSPKPSYNSHTASHKMHRRRRHSPLRGCWPWRWKEFSGHCFGRRWKRKTDAARFQSCDLKIERNIR
jgi:hypothetical protein